MKKIKELINTIIGLILMIALISAGLVFMTSAIIVAIASAIIIIGAITIPPIFKTIIARHKRKRGFKAACKEEGFKADMWEYSKALKDDLPFHQEAAIGALGLVQRLKKDPGRVEELKEMRDTLTSYIYETQLKEQSESQRTVYGFGADSEEFYADSEENREVLRSRVLFHPLYKDSNYNDIKLEYIGNYEGRENVVKKTTADRIEYFTLSETVELYIKEIKCWVIDQDYDINIELIKEIYKRKGIPNEKQKQKNY